MASAGDLPFNDPDEFLAEPDHGHLVDIQLRHDEQRLEAPPMFGAIEPAAVSQSNHRGAWLLLGGVGLTLGILAGFAGGFFVANEPPPAPGCTHRGGEAGADQRSDVQRGGRG